MKLKSLQLKNFKNHVRMEFFPCEGINCISGANGSGKTSVLDAIYYISFTKSFFHIPDQALIREGSLAMHIEASFNLDGFYHDISCKQIKGERKQFFWDGNLISKFADHIGNLPLVLVVPRDIELIYGTSDERRRWMDLVLLQTDRKYIFSLHRYQKALEQRNRLLKEDYISAEDARWDAFEHILAEEGRYIFQSRKLMMDAYEPFFKNALKFISNGKDDGEIIYQSAVHQPALYLTQLRESRLRDLAARRSFFGIHRDNLGLNMAGMELKFHGSQGQQKSFIIAMKMAMHTFIQHQTGKSPILMLDDIFEKLDEERSARLLEWVDSKIEAQVILTDTHQDRCREALSNVKRHVTFTHLI